MTNFWTAPRKTLLRRGAFQIHLWGGLLIGLYVVLVSLSGSALVFRDQIERGLDPALYHVQSSGRTLSLDKLLIAVRSAYPTFRVTGIDNLHSRQQPAIFYLNRAGPLSRSELMVYVDPVRGKLLGERFRYGGFLGWCANLHYYLLVGESGYIVNGVLAIVFLCLCLTGWLLWWPGIKRIRAGFRIFWRARWKRLVWDLHTVGGFWANPALMLIVLTGVYFVFPKPLLSIIANISGGSARTVREYFATPTSRHIGDTAISAQTAYAQIVKGLPSGTDLHYLALPAEAASTFGGIAYPKDLPSYSEPLHIYVDQYSGEIVRVIDTRHWPWGLRASTFVYAVHFGTFAGLLSQIVWFVLGIASAGLMATGTLMYWNRFLSPKRRKIVTSRAYAAPV